MNADDIMTVGAVTVRPDSTIEHAARLMIERQISGLPVVDDAGRLVGMVTERDLLHRPELGTERRRPRWIEIWMSPGRQAQEYARAFGRTVGDVMTHDVISVSPETEVGAVAELLEKHGVKRLPVVRDGKVVGIIGRANLVVALSRRVGEAPKSLADDIAIRRHILAEITSKSWGPAGTLDVVVRDGVVKLTGTVTDVRVRDAVRVAAENAPGVIRVWDNLEIVALPASAL